MRLFTLSAAVLIAGVLAIPAFGQEQQQQTTPMEVLRGGPGDDLLIGTDQRELLIGGTGADVIRGEGGSDVIEGGPGNDQLEAWEFEELYLDDDDGSE